MAKGHSKSGKHTDYLWMDGEIKPWEAGTVHIMSHTLHYGSGCFEGIKCYETDDGPAVFRLEDHIERMVASAGLYQIKVPYSASEIVAACDAVIRKNELTSAYVRPVLFYGFDTLGVHPNSCPVHVAVACFNWGAYLGEDGLNNGVRITMSSWRKFHHTSMPTVAKANGQYLNSMLAVQEARERGFDEALLLNMEGNIAEGSGQNLFLVKDGTLHTNDEQSSILMGITRDTIIQVAGNLGIPVTIADMTTEQLLEADEAFFTGTASEVTPIRELDGKTIGDGKPGEMTRRLRSLYFDIVQGRRSDYGHWLHYVK
ncbi:MAG: branched-chain amino acid transaminase [Candidatus Marinimicrobia bacterium]|nr:branched-chain amino acid transaminase [Candidatus Neomarinimicrobiota bacterium]